MGAPSESYVDPSIAGDSGSGTIGDPWGDLQFGLNQVTRDVTNGDRFNILTGTDEILAAALSLATYGTPAINQPLLFQGYTAAAGDGGIGGIDGNGASIFDGSAIDHFHWIDLHCKNSAANTMITIDNHCVFFNVQFSDWTGAGNFGILCDIGNIIASCYFHNSSGQAIQSDQFSYISNNYFENDNSRTFNRVIFVDQSFVISNVLNLDGATDGILDIANSTIVNNTVFSSSGTGNGIETATAPGVILNNYIEGFSGVGGVGMLIPSGDNVNLYGHNKFFNNTTNESISGDIILNLGNNDTLLASALIDAANEDFRVNTSVRALAYPTANYLGLAVRTFLDVGALQRQERPLTIAGMRFRPI